MYMSQYVSINACTYIHVYINTAKNICMYCKTKEKKGFNRVI